MAAENGGNSPVLAPKLSTNPEFESKNGDSLAFFHADSFRDRIPSLGVSTV